MPDAPPPLPQESLKFMKGISVYPLPGNIISTPNKVPAAPIIALPAAPDPPPPKNSIVGGPHLNGPTLQD